MATGTVKWFNADKGFGYIEDEDGRDVFVDAAAIRTGTRQLTEGDRVEFEVRAGPKGPTADDVVRVS